MALSENISEKPSQDSHKADKKEKLSTKVIIRRLPPSITQEDFITQVSPIPDYDYIYIVKGDMSLGENAFSRVYINFAKSEDIYIFKEKFDNYVFVDTKGHEYPAVVEYSSFQKVPKRRKARQDPKIDSIESDPIYQEFVESLKEQPLNTDEKPEYSYQPSNENKNDVTTPLLDYLKQRKIDRLRIMEEKRGERRKKEIERKKVREDDRRKRIEEKKMQTKNVLKESEAKAEPVKEVKVDEQTQEKAVEKSKKYEERKTKPKTKYSNEKKDFKNKREEYRDYQKSKYNDPKKFEPKEHMKKVKKYSERREERKKEEKKEEVKSDVDAKSTKSDEAKKDICKSEEQHYDECDGKHRNKENDPRMQRRIKNKDRPAMVLYKPGMLRKKSVDNDSKDRDKSPSATIDSTE